MFRVSSRCSSPICRLCESERLSFLFLETSPVRKRRASVSLQRRSKPTSGKTERGATWRTSCTNARPCKNQFYDEADRLSVRLLLGRRLKKKKKVWQRETLKTFSRRLIWAKLASEAAADLTSVSWAVEVNNTLMTH